MKKDAEKLMEALQWLIDGGRSAARELASEIDSDPDYNLEEAVAWLNDIVNGDEI